MGKATAPRRSTGRGRHQGPGAHHKQPGVATPAGSKRDRKRKEPVKPSLLPPTECSSASSRPGRQKGAAAGSSDGGVVDAVVGDLFSDWTVAAALADLMGRRPGAVQAIMQKWEKPILKVPIPGATARRAPSLAMLGAAKRAVVDFYDREMAQGHRSHVVKAFYMASGESELRFEWAEARRRVMMAELDYSREIDSWKDCLAMNSGETNADCKIYICGTRRITLRALTSLICHEGLHNLARRTRRGNPFLSEDTEHIAMALIGDPQLAA
mmetsp:Transcript_30253/g.85307  ORF Transcript_30253/g.85307 Transcript_30253/m.85307 type:complete len:269 (+) Transcript_30253:79-885(+)